MHLFADISSHGFGHLAITAPVLNAVAEIVPDLRLTVRCGLPAAKLRQRIRAPFEHIAAASDFGYVMIDATHIDLAASAAAYRHAHADWPARVAAEAAFLAALAPDLVLSNVSCLPLAGAARAGIPALALCSLNWADLFAPFLRSPRLGRDYPRRNARRLPQRPGVLAHHAGDADDGTRQPSTPSARLPPPAAVTISA